MFDLIVESLAAMRAALKVALGIVRFGIGAAGAIMAISVLVFGSVFEAIVTGMLAALFLWFAYLLSRQMRWHND
jgi:hypothetical protein